MSNTTQSRAPQRPADGTLVRQVNLQALLRKRAAEQFASVRAGHGPLAVGARAQKTAAPNDTSTNASSQRRSATGAPTLRTAATTQSLRSKRSNANLSAATKVDPVAGVAGPPGDHETSASAPRRTLKAKPSISTLRSSANVAENSSEGPHLASRSANVQTQAQHSTGYSSRGTPVMARTVKQSTIAASPVMAAMLKSRIPVSPQRRIKEVAEPLTPGSTRGPASGIGFSGGGIRVKAAGASTAAVGTPTIKAARSTKTASTPSSASTGSMRMTVGRGTQSPFAAAKSAAVTGIDEGGFRPVTVKTGYSG